MHHMTNNAAGETTKRTPKEVAVLKSLRGTHECDPVRRSWLDRDLRATADRMADRGVIGRGHVDTGSPSSRLVHFYLLTEPDISRAEGGQS